MFILQNLANNLVACKAAFYTFHSYITSEVNSTMRTCFCKTDLGQNAVFHNFARQIALIQYSGQSKHARHLHNKLKNWHFIKHFREENSIMPTIFSHSSLLLCGMQGNNGLPFIENVQKISKITFPASQFSLLTSATFTVRVVTCWNEQ